MNATQSDIAIKLASIELSNHDYVLVHTVTGDLLRCPLRKTILKFSSYLDAKARQGGGYILKSVFMLTEDERTLLFKQINPCN